MVPHVHVEEWPTEIVEFLSEYAFSDPQSSTKESSEWLNVVIQRYFIELRASGLFRSKTAAKISEKIAPKLKGNSFVSEINVTDIALGEHAPKIHSVSVVRGILEDDLAVFLDLEVTYVGGANISIEAKLAGGMTLPVKVYLKGLKGVLRVRVPSVNWSDMLSVSFVSDPGVDFNVDSPITLRDNQMVKDFVNNILAKIVRKVFVETWVQPSWRNFYLPLMQPYPEQILKRKTMNPTPSRPYNITDFRLVQSGRKFSIAGSTSDSNRKPSPDVLRDSFYPSDILLSETIYTEYRDKLVDIFSEIAALVDPQDPDHTLFKHKRTWKVNRNQYGVLIEKARVLLTNAELAEITKSVFSVPFDPHLVFFVRFYCF